MAELRQVCMPRTPECWDSCGACGSGDVFVLDVLVSAGEIVRADDNLITLETGKVALDIPTPYGGRIVDVLVEIGDTLVEGQPLVTLAAD